MFNKLIELPKWLNTEEIDIIFMIKEKTIPIK